MCGNEFLSSKIFNSERRSLIRSVSVKFLRVSNNGKLNSSWCNQIGSTSGVAGSRHSNDLSGGNRSLSLGWFLYQALSCGQKGVNRLPSSQLQGHDEDGTCF